MNCPYCNKVINAFTGLQELQKFHKHLQKCRKAPGNIKSEGVSAVADKPDDAHAKKLLMTVPRPYTMNDALEIRADSGQ